MTFERTLAIAKKEVFHIIRDPFTLALALLLPVMMVSIFGLAIEFNIKNIPIAVYDGDRTQSSRKLIEVLRSSRFFLPVLVESQQKAVDHIDSDRTRAALIIEPEFEYRLLSNRGAKAQVILDGSDNSTTGTILSYLNNIQNIAVWKITGQTVSDPVALKTRFLYNPELNSRWFTVPGLLVVVLGILSILLTALAIAREWENGSMELLLSTPVEPLEIIIGKIAPYVVLGLGAVSVVYLTARGFLGVPFRGSHVIFVAGCLLFLTTSLAQGLLISVLTRSQQLAMQFSMITGLLPAVLLSGFIFPIESMPPFFQVFTAILPVRWFTMICRDVFLKGSGVIGLKVPFLALIAMATVLVFLASRKFKKDVEP